jgi:glutamate/tyrosine decarboxylase-like PLP-dependent enzyme
MYARRLPQYDIPEEEMPPEAAYSLIQDELLTGDVTPALKYVLHLFLSLLDMRHG